jgi:hypothetical protein
VCVGTRVWEKWEPCLDWMWFWVRIGSSVEAMVQRCMVWLFERMSKASRGPAQSRSWKPGKIITPILEGRTSAGILVSSVVLG